MNADTEGTRTDRWQLVAGWFLLLSYFAGSPVFAFIEAKTGLFSERFNYPSEFLYLVSGIQFICSLVLFVRALAPWSALVLTVITVGAVLSHLRIDSAITALPALAYSAIQIWYGIRVNRSKQDVSA